MSRVLNLTYPEELKSKQKFLASKQISIGFTKGTVLVPYSQIIVPCNVMFRRYRTVP